MLSPNTLYGGYLLVKISERAYGLDLVAAQVSVEVGNQFQLSQGSVWLQQKDKKKQELECLFYGNRRERLRKLVGSEEGDQNNEKKNEIRVLREREDGWFEIELGQFFSAENDDHEVNMSLMEIKGFQLKAGLIVQGIQIRPKH